MTPSAAILKRESDRRQGMQQALNKAVGNAFLEFAAAHQVDIRHDRRGHLNVRKARKGALREDWKWPWEFKDVLPVFAPDGEWFDLLDSVRELRLLWPATGQIWTPEGVVKQP